MLRIALFRGAVLLSGVALAACTATTSPTPGGGATMSESGGTEIDATLMEFEVQLSATSAPAGPVTFNITNDGTQTHEFVVIQTDTPADELPANSAVEESQLTVVDEIEEIEAGASDSLTVDLAAGHYAIICNVPGHYRSGMHADFTAE
jgi:uncharacterized cupredoxin-like copper-binding protein